jgi:hypothetical protein
VTRTKSCGVGLGVGLGVSTAANGAEETDGLTFEVGDWRELGVPGGAMDGPGDSVGEPELAGETGDGLPDSVATVDSSGDPAVPGRGAGRATCETVGR